MSPTHPHDLGGFEVDGTPREMTVQPTDAGGWCMKAVPGQIVADFTDKAEADFAAAAWNAAREAAAPLACVVCDAELEPGEPCANCSELEDAGMSDEDYERAHGPNALAARKRRRRGR